MNPDRFKKYKIEYTGHKYYLCKRDDLLTLFGFLLIFLNIFILADSIKTKIPVGALVIWGILSMTQGAFALSEAVYSRISSIGFDSFEDAAIGLAKLKEKDNKKTSVYLD